MPRITEIEYGRVVKLGKGFENEKVRVVAIVNRGEDPDEAFDFVKRWVRMKLRLAGLGDDEHEFKQSTTENDARVDDTDT